MNNFDQFEALTATDVTDINGGGLLDFLAPGILVNDPLGLLRNIVDPLLTGAGANPLAGNLGGLINNLLSALRPLPGSIIPQ
ncbi:hypothetical protein D3H65_27820 [Paraflavitalea soli]|uniref:Uncharacterized protein n=1 Tax=Paraflavitalea soli TaxID=2315862 RepID=A0A3B7N678_9BACT|nr:hypothetical protein [Paraflavitalea soli]AXY77561.1 hypothetical protein D3H65_27820 [Paraflavitalea soli]